MAPGVPNGDSTNTHTKPKRYELDPEDCEDGYVPECGVWRLKPAVLKTCANMAAFTGIYSFSGLLTSTLSSYVNSQVTTLERHFGFNSAQTGLIMAANDVGFLVIVLFVSYIAAQVHIPRALGFVTILFGISGVVCALPQFFFGAPSYPKTGAAASNVSRMTSFRGFGGQICDGIEEPPADCDFGGGGGSGMMSHVTDNARANSGAALAIIVIGMVLQGVAKTPRSSFVTTYVDANVEKTKTGFYVGIITTVGIMGPAIAFALGGVFTRIYVTLEDTDLHPRHPKWIGAWWLGYITFGLAACVFALPLFCFPRWIKGRKPTKLLDNYSRSDSKGKNVALFAKGWLMAVYRLVTNPVYVCNVLSSCSLLFAVAGGQSFSPKYIENQFSFPAWRANLSMAAIMLGTACVGTFIGGYLSKRFKMGPLVSLKFITVVQTLSVISTGITMVFKCDQPFIYNSPGPRAVSDEAMSGCYDNCACDDNDFFPICDGDGRTFFSPCHAGCTETKGNTYMNCTCIPGGVATAGMCDYSCPMFFPYIITVAISALTATFAIIPKLIVYIRCVEERDKPLALGLSSFMTSVTGWMLGPIVFGKLIDDICIQWENPEDSCTGRGACRLYDNDIFRLKLLGYQTAFRCLGLVFSGSALVVALVTKKFENTGEATEKQDQELKVSLTKAQESDKNGDATVSTP